MRADVPRLLDTFGSPVRGGALYFDLARAYAQAEGDRDREAIECLDAADRMAPQYVRPDPMAGTWCSPWTGAPGDGCGSSTRCVTASVSAARVHGM
ncbi:MAG: hypothetical protein WCC47_11615 [Pseudonocardiaceae bacterium]